MIRAEESEADQMVTTSIAHVEAVADRHDLPVVEAGGYFYCVRRVPLLGQPIIYRAPVDEVSA